MPPTILTITLNPTIDKSTTIERMVPESKLRCSAVKYEPGGGGINVSKALKELGCNSITIFPAGGHNGEMLKSLLQRENISFLSIPVEKETRENYIVLETSTNKQFRFNLPGESTDIPIVEKVIDYISENNFEFIICSGSLLPGLPDETYTLIAAAAKNAGARFILDTSGLALKTAVEKGVYMLKPNIGELANLAGLKWLETDKVEVTARALIDKGWVEIIAVSMGKHGAIMVTKNETYKTTIPEMVKKSTVGAGDSMVAGMVYMLSQKKTLREVLQFGVACGTAATMNPGTELFHKEAVFKLYEQIKK